jgi:transcriptional regulator with XRE-family HTH domain
MIFETDEKLYSTLEENIKYFRNKAGLSQKELSEKSGVSLSYISKLESHVCMKNVSISILNRIANALDIRLARLFEKRPKF